MGFKEIIKGDRENDIVNCIVDNEVKVRMLFWVWGYRVC